MGFLDFFTADIAIDLGTANTLVTVKGKGIVIDEPSVVAIDRETRRPMAFGLEAKQMVGRTPARIVAVRPLRDGVISDFDTTEKMLEYFITKVHEQNSVTIPRPRVVVGIPSGVTEVERRAVHDASLNAGARVAAGAGRQHPVHRMGGLRAARAFSGRTGGAARPVRRPPADPGWSRGRLPAAGTAR